MPQGGGSNEQTSRDVKDATTAEGARPETAGATAVPVGELLEAKLAELEAQIAQLKEERLRALAEVENVRRRAARDRQDASQYAITSFARDILSVADNLQRALAIADTTARSEDPALNVLMSGVEMTERELLQVLERYGVKPIPAEGVLFDPHVHEAMFEIPNESVPHGTVLQVLQQGYLLHDRTLRPSRVGISRGGPKLQPGAVPPATEAPTAAVEEPNAAATEPELVAAEPADASRPASGAETSRPAGGADVEPPVAAEAGAGVDEKIIDFLKRASGESYPRQSGGEPRTGSRVDEKF